MKKNLLLLMLMSLSKVLIGRQTCGVEDKDLRERKMGKEANSGEKGVRNGQRLLSDAICGPREYLDESQSVCYACYGTCLSCIGPLPTDCKECIKDRRFPHQVHGSLYPLKEEPASAECICMRGQKDGHNFTCVPKYDEKTFDLTILIVTFCIIFLISYILIKLFPNRHYTAEMIEFEASRHLPSFNKEMEFKDSPTDQDEEELKPSSNRMETEGVLFTSK